MKTKVSIYLKHSVERQLDLANREPGRSKSAIVEEALSRLFDPERQWGSALTKRLDRVDKRFSTLQRDGAITAETVAMHMHLYLTHVPPLTGPNQDAQRALASKRYYTSAKT